ncbi:MAG: hypothetical protein KF712_07795 [Akkermansiaceae bacterium]|nr:hypothetical protein [Akkermansiaceae bacterium]
MNPEEWHRLTRETAENRLTAEDAARILRHWHEDTAARDELLRALLVDRLLPVVLKSSAPATAADEVTQSLQKHRADEAATLAEQTVIRLRHSRRGTMVKRISLAAATITLGCVPLALMKKSAARPAGELTGSEAIEWDTGDRPPGPLVPGTHLRARSGLARILLENGATLLAEAPFDFKIRSPMAIDLNRGLLVVHCPPTAHGLEVRTTRGIIVDRGTTFGIEASGDDPSVHVIEGLVDVRPENHITSSLREGEAARLESSGPRSIPINAGIFLNSLPEKSPENRPRPFIHWRLDEGDGLISADSGNGLATPGEAELRFRAYPEGTPVPLKGPSWVTGKFGSALYFNGDGASAESDFPGILGSATRSISMWVRIPPDVSPDQGHGFLSWGTSRQGSIWQLSANGVADDGAPGALRVGTFNRGMIIGTTDLRDDRWHHVAVVMYGGDKPNLSTNVLLYVDGRLERVSRRTFTPIDTASAPPGEGVRLGRNAASATSKYAKRFFRGSVDEVFIFDSALSSEEVIRLMRHNTLR